MTTRWLCQSVLCASLGFTALHCGDPKGGGPQTPGPKTDLPPIGDAITAPPNTWTWVDFPDSFCDDGSTTGLGVNLNGSNSLFVFLMGGGACWDYTTCALFNTSAHGPFGQTQFNGLAVGLSGSILERTAQNPFGSYNLALIPYCTGDVHAGDNDAVYDDGMGKTRAIKHHGWKNVIAFLRRLAATVPAPQKLIVAGSSAGGFGSAATYGLFRNYFPTSKVYLLDDSGPPFIGDGVPPTRRSEWYASWALSSTIGLSCPGCQQDLSKLATTLAQSYPNDRMALLSYTQDSTIRQFYEFQTPTQFQTNLYDLATQVLEPQPQFRYYRNAQPKTARISPVSDGQVAS